MKTFEKFNSFLMDLIGSIHNGKDVYVFNYPLDEKSDYQRCESYDGSIEYYTHYGFDLNSLQENMFYTYSEDEENYNLHIVLDFVKDGDNYYKRLFIFRS